MRWLLPLVLTSCVIAKRPVALPEDDQPALLVLSGAMSEPIRRVGRHAWFGIRDPGGSSWQRWECCPPHGRAGDPLHAWTESGDVRVHGVFQGTRAHQMIECVRRETERYEHKSEYAIWPGPNSNTYVETMLRRCGIPVDLPATCVGRDYRGALGASLTSRGTGVQIESPVFGIKIGFFEGIEVHFFALAFGIDFWPPAIILPFEAGRLGFDDR